MTPSPAAVSDARKRSVDNLQRLYAFVVGLAITESLKKLVPDRGGKVNVAQLLMVVSLLVTVIPFYHGSNRYLDATYVTGEHQTRRRWTLMYDFVMLFLQALTIFLLAIFTTWDEQHFYKWLAYLFFIDAIWLLSSMTFLDTYPFKGLPTPFRRLAWIILSLAFSPLLLALSHWGYADSTVSHTTLNWVLMFVAVGRTFADYALVFDFYFPKKEDAAKKVGADEPAACPEVR
jgi:hypothetical protein